MRTCFPFALSARGRLTGLLGVLLLGSTGCRAQGLIATMLEQISRLDLTLQEAKKGYAIVQQGLTLIGDIKHADFLQHSDHFASLLSVKAPIRSDVRIAAIAQMQIWITTTCGKTVGQLASTGAFSPAHLAYVGRVLATVSTATDRDITELSNILSNGFWQMSDDQRLARLDVLYHRVSQTYGFLQSFCDATRNGGNLRLQEQKNYSTLRQLF